jgi:hypothetical protein
MPPGVPLVPERPPRRARYLIPPGTPRRGEVLAAPAVVAALAAALLAPLTLLLLVAFHTTSKISRWRPVWLAVPACCGAIWLLAAGPGTAVAAFGAAMGSVATVLSRLITDPPVLASLPGAEVHELAGQYPVALILAAGAAAVAWWVRWLHTDEWDLPAIRPGLASFCRRQWTAASVRSGGIVTRDGACLGIDRATGGPAALSWRDAGGGVLVTGAARPAVLASGWQLAHAAIRRRKPVIIVDLTGCQELPGWLAAVCSAAAAPLQVFGEARYLPGLRPAEDELAILRASPLGRWLGPGQSVDARISLAEVVRRRAVLLFSLDRRRYGRAAEVVADLVAADLAAAYAALGRKGVPSEGLCWFTECDGIDAEALASLVAPGSQPGLAAVLATSAPDTAARLAGQVGAGVFYRLADRDLAGELAVLTGTRLVAVAQVRPQAAEADAAPGPAVPLGTAPVPVVSAEELCGLGDDEFVLVTGLTTAPVTVLPRCQAVAGPVPAQTLAQAPGQIPRQIRARRQPPARALVPPGRRA